MPTSMDWELTPLAGLDALWWRDWDALNNAHLGSHPGLSATFARLMVKYFSRSSVLGATLRSGTSTLIKTLLVKSAPAQWQIFCPAQATVAPLVFDRALKNPTLPLVRLLTRLPGCALKLDLLNQDSRFSMLSRPDLQHSRTTATWTSLTILEPKGFSAYWESRPKELRENLRRRARRAEKDKLEFRLEVHSEPAAVAVAVDRFGALESLGWKGRAGSSLHPDNDQGRFYRELMQTMAAENNAKVFEIRAGEQLAASRLVLFGGSTATILKTTHHEAFGQYSVGHVLLHHVLNDMMDRNADIAIEFYSHASRELLLWATRTIPMQNMCIYRSRGLKLLAAVRDRLRKRRSDMP